jgi:peptidyl-prolyl cis-trans isomerase SurA
VATTISSASKLHRISLAALFALLLAGCSAKEHELVVATVGDKQITVPEYRRMYTKSIGGLPGDSSVTQADREKFLDLLVKYRLKLTDAYRENLDKDPSVVNEIDHYKGSLAQSFLTEREVIAPGVRRLYERRTEEVRAAHILLELAQTGIAADSAQAYALANDIMKQLRAGKDFGDLAVQYSKDPSVKTNRGDLYYASGGDFVEPFETAVYSLKAGELLSYPVRTQFGLHIIKLLDRKPNPGQVRASHIMIRFTGANPTPDDTAAAYAKIKKIQDSVATGVDFAELAKRNSADAGSALNGGDLGLFGRRRWIRPFDDTVMTMKVGQVSGIVRTSYGYHLIKCTDLQPPKPFPEAKQEIEQLYQQRRFQEDNAQYLQKLRTELQFTRNDSVIVRFIASLDSTKAARDSIWGVNVAPALRKAAIVTILGRPVTVDSFMTLYQSRQDMVNQLVNAINMYTAVDKISEQILYSAKANSLMRDNTEFQGIITEYKEGILLYQIEQDRVWSKITPSDSLLRKYFAEHRDKFRYPDRVRFSELRFTTDPAASKAREQLLAGTPFPQLVVQDSLRMALPSNFSAVFGRGSAVLSKATKRTLDSIAAQLTSDPVLSTRLTASPDTTMAKEKNMKTAQRRIEAMKTHLAKTHGIKEEAILVTLTPQAADGTSKSVRTQRADKLSASIIGRQPRVIGTVNHLVLDPAADDRGRKADSLKVGEVTPAFFFKNGYSLVRLDGREPARPKTYDEAGPELSTAFQDYEAKRLEQDWISSLRQQFPVVEKKDVLQNAFSQAK